RTVRLEDNPAFEALSYEWRDPGKSHSISVGGKRFRVTANLWNALHNVRHETEARAIWVDAISIDQTHLDEKSSQVPLMSLIYRRARSVLIFLG
ncbi:heterokaryon incompatibility, partial [Dactylonectria macrodidyma]